MGSQADGGAKISQGVVTVAGQGCAELGPAND